MSHSTTVPIVQVHQETECGNNDESGYASPSSLLRHPCHYKAEQFHSQHSTSLESCKLQPQIQNPMHEQSQIIMNESVPVSEPRLQQKATKEGNFDNSLIPTMCTHIVPHRKVSKVSTIGSCSACSSLLEMAPLPLSTLSLQFQSDPSSSDVSHENALNSSSSQVGVESATKPSSSHHAGNLQSQQQWYQTSISSLPAEQHFCSNAFVYPYSATATPARPMGRSVSQEYYHQPTRPCRRRHTMTPTDVTSCTNCSACSHPKHLVVCSQEQELQQLCTCHTMHLQNQCSHHGHLCDIPGHHRNCVRMCPVMQKGSCGCGGIHFRQQPPSRDIMSYNEGAEKNWCEGKYENCTVSNRSTKISNLERENLYKHQPLDEELCTVNVDMICRGTVGNSVRGPQSLANEENVNSKSPTNDRHLMERISNGKLPVQQMTYESGTLTPDMDDLNSREEHKRNSVRSLSSFVSASSEKVSKFRTKSSSVGNHSSVATSARSSASENTITGFSIKSPIGSPPMFGSQGK